MALNDRDRARLVGVHKDLVSIIERAAEQGSPPFRVVQGLRTKDEQAKLVAEGASTTMNSRHLDGHAVDLVPLHKGRVSWHWPHFYPLARAIKRASVELNIPIEWGGDWRTFPDGAHFQLPWREYP